ncbi:MAG: class I SAM-dependent methyltransferase, partial [Chlamydiota bacterium]|nr:class I SAM-dependent methyltransferase [Chlamydiota bacterium]
IDPQLILHCKQSYPNSVFVTSDCYSIPLDSKKFDTVVMCMIIEHLKNPVHALTEAKRLLKPGGNIVVVVPRKDDWFYRFIVKKDPTHVREYNVVEISDLLRTVFTIENICFGSVSTKVPSFLTWFLKPDIIINCKKDN